MDITRSAIEFVLDPRAFSLDNFARADVHHKLFSISPEGKDELGRCVPIANMATDQIKDIISCAAADVEAQKRINFYLEMSKEPMFGVARGKLFERFVLTWLSSGSSVSLPCAPSSKHPSLARPVSIPSCRCQDQQKICGSLTDLQKTKLDNKKLPFCFLPSSKSFATVDAIIFTKQLIITIQVTIASSHDAKSTGFSQIKEKLPKVPKADGRRRRNQPPWCHVFITDDEEKAKSLRDQNLTGLPSHIHIYSAVFDTSKLQVASKRMMEQLVEAEVRGSAAYYNQHSLGE